MSKQIKLSLGKVTIVDDSEYAYLSNFKWYCQKDQSTDSYYAARTINVDGKMKNLSMHRL